MAVKENKPLRLYICIPCYKNIPFEFVVSLFTALSELPQKGFATNTDLSDSCYVDHNRNQLASNAVNMDRKDGLDYILWLDSDMVFKTKDIIMLIGEMEEKKLDFLSASYFTEDADGSYRVVASELKEGPQEMVGMGFMLMKPKALRKILLDNGFPLFKNVYRMGQLMGEDKYFCELARNSGFKIHLSTVVSVGHLRGAIWKRDFECWKQKQNTKSLTDILPGEIISKKAGMS